MYVTCHGLTPAARYVVKAVIRHSTQMNSAGPPSSYSANSGAGQAANHAAAVQLAS